MRLLPIRLNRQRPVVRLGSTQVLPFMERSFALGPNELKSHIHCIGLSGAGKSKMLANFATQMILQGQAVGVVDPHADLAHDVLALLLQAGYFRRKEATQKLLYVDFSNREAALPFNVLKQPYPVEEVARLVMEACSRAWPALADGQSPQLENVLLASVPVLIANDLPLTDMTRLLSDKPYRERLLRQVADPQILSLFHDRFDQWGREAPLMIESTLRRVFLLSYSPTLRYALSQQENALNFRALIDEQTSVIFNLGGLDEQTQKLLGCLVTVGYEVAALSRADMLEEQRTPYHLVLDEFASFSAQSEEALARMLSLTRKYGLFCTLAHQTFSQLSSRLAGALQNTLQIAFRVGRDDALWAAPRFGSFNPLKVKHVVEDEAAEPRTHPVFLSVQETYEGWAKALESLKPREAFIRAQGKTVKIRTQTIKHHVKWSEIERLRAQYATQLLTPRAALSGADVPMPGIPDAMSAAEKAVSRVVPLFMPLVPRVPFVPPAPLFPRVEPTKAVAAAEPETLKAQRTGRPKRIERPKNTGKPGNASTQRNPAEKAPAGIVVPLRRSVTPV